NAAQEGIARSLADQIGAGRGDVFTPNSSAFIIARDPFRAIRRGRQLFQRNYDRSIRTEFLTRPLWGVGTTVPFGHDGPAWPCRRGGGGRTRRRWGRGARDRVGDLGRRVSPTRRRSRARTGPGP